MDQVILMEIYKPLLKQIHQQVFPLLDTQVRMGNGTIGHGLGVAPKFVIVKRRPTASDWAVYHEGLGNSVRLVLNSTSGASNASAGWWNNTSPNIFYCISW